MKTPDQLRPAAPAFPSVTDLVNEIVRAVVPASAQITETTGRNGMEELAALSSALIAVANQTWRIGAAAFDAESKEPKAEFSAQDIRKICNAFEALKATTEAIGIKIVDRLNEPFNPGLPDQVVTEEPREGISKEQIIRTIRPTILWHQTMVQRGEIDIAVPAAKK
jgi:hypothetical protein